MAIRVKAKQLKSGEHKLQIFGAGPCMYISVEDAKDLIADLYQGMADIKKAEAVAAPVVIGVKTFH